MCTANFVRSAKSIEFIKLVYINIHSFETKLIANIIKAC